MDASAAGRVVRGVPRGRTVGAVDAGVRGRRIRRGRVRRDAGCDGPSVGERVVRRRPGRVLGDVADVTVRGAGRGLAINVVAPEAGATGVVGLLLPQFRTGAGRTSAVGGVGPRQRGRVLVERGDERDGFGDRRLRFAVRRRGGDLVVVGTGRERAAGLGDGGREGLLLPEDAPRGTRGSRCGSSS